jgi:hypothetical protein
MKNNWAVIIKTDRENCEFWKYRTDFKGRKILYCWKEGRPCTFKNCLYKTEVKG